MLGLLGFLRHWELGFGEKCSTSARWGWLTCTRPARLARRSACLWTRPALPLACFTGTDCKCDSLSSMTDCASTGPSRSAASKAPSTLQQEPWCFACSRNRLHARSRHLRFSRWAISLRCNAFLQNVRRNSEMSQGKRRARSKCSHEFDLRELACWFRAV